MEREKIKNWKLILRSIPGLLILFFGTLQAQNEDFLFGQLVDAKENEPVPFASIRVKDRPIGVISNIDGTFKIPKRIRTFGELLEISCMGYATKTIPIDDLILGQSNVIILKPGEIVLPEAVVSTKIKRLTAKKIVQIAVNSILQNYPLQDFALVGYYRDYQIKSGGYTNLNEAIVRVFDEGFSQGDGLQNKYQVFDYKENEEFPRDAFAEQPYDYRDYDKVIPSASIENRGGNELLTLMVHDALRNHEKESLSFIDYINVDFLDVHRFKLVGKTKYDDQTVYEIDCRFRNDDYYAEGKIFVNAEDFSIHNLEYQVYLRKRPNELDIAINPEERYSDGFSKMNREMLYSLNLEYVRRQDQKMYLNYISFYNKVLLHRPAEFASKFVIGLRDRTFRIRLNKMPFRPDKIKESDFRIAYEGRRIPIKEFYFLEDERTFVVCPHLKYEKAEEDFNYLFTETDSLEVSDVTYGYHGIKDSLGNKLDERKFEYLHQYREFFTQEVIPILVEEPDSLSFINMFRPLSETRKRFVPKDADTYWMNTPRLPDQPINP